MFLMILAPPTPRPSFLVAARMRLSKTRRKPPPLPKRAFAGGIFNAIDWLAPKKSRCSLKGFFMKRLLLLALFLPSAAAARNCEMTPLAHELQPPEGMPQQYDVHCDDGPSRTKAACLSPAYRQRCAPSTFRRHVGANPPTTNSETGFRRRRTNRASLRHRALVIV